jgi:hypothetical protein
MQTPPKQEKSSFFKRLKLRRTRPNDIQTHSEAPVAHVHKSDSTDRMETMERFVKAATCLNKAVQWWVSDGDSSLEFLELAGEPEVFDRQFTERLDKALDSRKESTDGETIKSIFTALSPFAKTFLIIAKEAQSVLFPKYISDKSRYLCSTHMDCFVEVFLS